MWTDKERLSLDPWAAAKKSLSQYGSAANFCPGSQPSDKGDNGMILGAVHRSPGIYLTAEENPGKPQLGNLR